MKKFALFALHQSQQLLHQNLIVPLVVYVGGLDVYFIFVFGLVL